MTTLKLNSNIILNCHNDGIRSQIISENRFKNPTYLSNEQNGHSNWNTDPYIETFRCVGDEIVLPRGFARDLMQLFFRNNIRVDIIDERISNHCIYPEKLEGIVLRPYQQRCVEAALKYDQGVIVAPTGSGKSLVGLEIIRQRQQKSLIIVHRNELAEQWSNIIQSCLGINPGLIGDGKWEVGDKITIALIQTLSSRENEAKENLTNVFGLVLCDECHHSPAESFFNVLGWMEAKYRYGLSATLNRRDGLERMIFRAIGPSLSEIAREEVEEIGATVPVTVKLVNTGFSSFADSWNGYLSDISESQDRNLLIVNLAIHSTAPTIVLTDRVAHAEDLSDIFERHNVPHILAHGKLRDRNGLLEKIKHAQITIGTTGLLGEGLDVSSWEVLILTTPISSEIKLMQAIGRVVRAFSGKKCAVIYDLKDDCGFAGSSFKKRYAIYRKNNIWVEFEQNKKAA